MRSILLHVSDDDCLEARTQVALDLARAFDAHLTCLQALPSAMPVSGMYGVYMDDLIPAMREAAASHRANCQRRLAGEDVLWSWSDEDGLLGDVLLRQGALNDLVIVGSNEPSQIGPSKLAAHLALKGRTPLLIVPQSSGSLDCSGAAIVAWNGSGEAARALKGALPLLAKARSVSLVVIGGQYANKVELPGAEAAQYLSRHGISCELVEIPYDGRSVAEILTSAVVARDAAYLVMGAYGLPRLVETLLGGTTRDLFAKPPVPIFTCH